MKTKKTNKIPKVLVHLHMYYPEQIDYILNKLKNINSCNWDLIVTICEENSKLENKIRAFKPDVIFLRVNNAGYDVWPFLQALKKFDLDNYDYVLKLHTKNCARKHFRRWRNILFNALLRTPKRFRQNLELFENNPKIGVIGADAVKSEMTGPMPEENELFWSFCKKYNFNLTKGTFVSGTMFIIRTSLLKPILALDLKEEDFYGIQVTEGRGTLAHVLERVFCRIAELQGYKVYTIKDFLFQLETTVKSFMQWIFAVVNREYDGKMYKQINILGFKIKFLKHK